VSKTIKEYEEMLEDMHFFRVHNSHIINLRYVKNYKKGEGGIVKMEDGSEIEVSRRRKDDFLIALHEM
jgi:two-component system LytT family response regulator